MTSRDRIIDMYLQGYTQSEIARQVGVSRQRVNQVIKAHNMELDLLKAKAARRLADIVIEENERLKAFITKLVSEDE